MSQPPHTQDPDKEAPPALSWSRGPGHPAPAGGSRARWLMWWSGVLVVFPALVMAPMDSTPMMIALAVEGTLLGGFLGLMVVGSLSLQVTHGDYRLQFEPHPVVYSPSSEVHLDPTQLELIASSMGWIRVMAGGHPVVDLPPQAMAPTGPQPVLDGLSRQGALPPLPAEWCVLEVPVPQGRVIRTRGLMRALADNPMPYVVFAAVPVATWLLAPLAGLVHPWLQAPVTLVCLASALWQLWVWGMWVWALGIWRPPATVAAVGPAGVAVVGGGRQIRLPWAAVELSALEGGTWVQWALGGKMFLPGADLGAQLGAWQRQAAEQADPGD